MALYLYPAIWDWQYLSAPNLIFSFPNMTSCWCPLYYIHPVIGISVSSSVSFGRILILIFRSIGMRKGRIFWLIGWSATFSDGSEDSSSRESDFSKVWRSLATIFCSWGVNCDSSRRLLVLRAIPQMTMALRTSSSHQHPSGYPLRRQTPLRFSKVGRKKKGRCTLSESSDESWSMRCRLRTMTACYINTYSTYYIPSDFPDTKNMYVTLCGFTPTVCGAVILCHNSARGSDLIKFRLPVGDGLITTSGRTIVWRKHLVLYCHFCRTYVRGMEVIQFYSIMRDRTVFPLLDRLSCVS